MAEYDPNAPNSMRYPRVTTMDEMEQLPRLPFNTGIDTCIFLSREATDTRYFRHGICWPGADHAGYTWEQYDFDETHWVIKGKIRLRVKDVDGREIVLEAKEGEHIYCPGGYVYTLEATGVDSAFYWTSGPSNRNGLVEVPEFSAAMRTQRK